MKELLQVIIIIDHRVILMQLDQLLYFGFWAHHHVGSWLRIIRRCSWQSDNLIPDQIPERDFMA
jgi:hypothetical protein